MRQVRAASPRRGRRKLSFFSSLRPRYDKYTAHNTPASGSCQTRPRVLKYKKQKEKSKTSKKETFLTDDEIKKYELMYLKEYERELLDLSDFNHYPELSPFDDVKIK